MSVGPPTTDVSRATPDDNSCGSGIPLVLQLLHCHHVAVGVLVLLVVLLLPQLQHLECCKEERRGRRACTSPASRERPSHFGLPPRHHRPEGAGGTCGAPSLKWMQGRVLRTNFVAQEWKAHPGTTCRWPGLKMPLCRRCSKQVLTKQAFWAKIIGGQLPLGGGVMTVENSSKELAGFLRKENDSVCKEWLGG